MAKAKNINVRLPRTKATNKPAPVKVAKPVTKVASDNLLSRAATTHMVPPAVIKSSEVIGKPHLPIESINPVVVDQVPGLPIVDSYTEPVLSEVDSLVSDQNEYSAKPRSGRGVIVGLIGGSVVGYMAYNGIKTVLLDKGYDQDKANRYALISAGVCALLTFTILYNLIKKAA